MRIFLFLIVFLCESLSAQQAEFVFTKAPFPSCHASTLTQTPSGALLCAWFAGENEGENDVKIWLSTLEKAEWSQPKIIASANDVPCWNPVLFTMPSGEILLFYKEGKNPKEWSGVLKRSFDGGKKWSIEEPLPAGVIGPVKNRPLLQSDGTLLCGSSIESFRRWGCWIDVTKDKGLTWEKSTPINVEGHFFGIIQPTLFITQDGVIHLLARSHQMGYIYQASSTDGGKTWSPAVTTSLPNPNSGIDALTLQDGRIALVYNHSQIERTPLNIAVSEDGGKTWTVKVVLEDTPGEYSYPSICQANDGKIHIVYTWNRQRIKHVALEPSDL